MKDVSAYSRLIILAGLFLLALGCSAPKSKSEIYGTYIAEHEFAKEALVIKKDGLFEQKVKLISNGAVFESSGKWDMSIHGNSSVYIRFDKNFLMPMIHYGIFNENFAGPSRGGPNILPVEYLWGNLEIGTREGTVYKKLLK